MITENYKLIPGLNEAFDKLSYLMLNHKKSELIEEYLKCVKNGSFDLFITETLSHIESDSSFTPIWISATECPIIATANSVVSLRYFNPNSEQLSIYGAPEDILLTLLSSHSNVEVDIYNIIEPSYSLELAFRERLEKHDTITIKKGQTFKIISDSGIVLSRLLMGLAKDTPVFDAKSLEFISMLSLNPTDSRWYFMAKTAGKLESSVALPLLNKLIFHENYNVRWTALQEIFNHDVNSGLSILENFKDDPSPYIRDEARKEHFRIKQIMRNGHGYN
ncbi:HEAT repeat domain-containing protein [Shewanella benthica]|uniref:HEAT repeat domain-containing protein n=1 Tax=Shewanella benthica KT99 TaxID=314608 RepID=A9DJB9_9GAMM|nr:HEAT repeat domain-containing protein [Shewanella benthica]EDP98983.1 hypothetical protein KT99_00161 [Shewanella benthica KT99]